MKAGVCEASHVKVCYGYKLRHFFAMSIYTCLLGGALMVKSMCMEKGC